MMPPLTVRHGFPTSFLVFVSYRSVNAIKKLQYSQVAVLRSSVHGSGWLKVFIVKIVDYSFLVKIDAQIASVLLVQPLYHLQLPTLRYCKHGVRWSVRSNDAVHMRQYPLDGREVSTFTRVFQRLRPVLSINVVHAVCCSARCDASNTRHRNTPLFEQKAPDPATPPPSSPGKQYS
jgi:hypothetical protein